VVTVYSTKIDWWLRPLLLVPLFGGGASIYTGLARSDATTVLIGAAALAAYALLTVALGWPIRYTVSPQELEVRFGVIRRHLPWDRVIDMQLSRNPLSSPAFSLDRIAVRFTTTAGHERSLLISPPDREQFLADCARASGRHRVTAGHLVRS
jgi:membrane protein YdbS with pleckstrin-like domain